MTSASSPVRTGIFWLAAFVTLLALSACADAGSGPSTAAANEAKTMTANRKAGSVTVTGSRLTKGNAVNCPEIRTDDGAVIPVKGMTADIALGQRVTVTGSWGVSTSCTGRVLIIEKLDKT